MQPQQPSKQEQLNHVLRMNFLEEAIALETELAIARGHTIFSFWGGLEGGVVCVDDGDNFPRYGRDLAATFELMAQQNCIPTRSSLSIPYERGYAMVVGTKAIVDLKNYQCLEDAYAIVIMMAAIEKLKQ